MRGEGGGAGGRERIQWEDPRNEWQGFEGPQRIFHSNPYFENRETEARGRKRLGQGSQSHEAEDLGLNQRSVSDPFENLVSYVP